MLDWLMTHVNRAYAKLLLKVGKWALGFLLITILCLGVGFKFIMPKGMKAMKQSSNATVIKGADGQSQVLYKDKALPKDYEGELASNGPELIYENQTRSMDQSEQSSGAEDDPYARQAKVEIPASELKELKKLTSKFLGSWETFGILTTPQDYFNQLQPYLDERISDDPHNSVVERADNYQSAIVGPGKQVGSRMVFDGFVPAGSMMVRRYNATSAYVTAMGEVVLGGNSLVLQNKRYIRSYALVLHRSFQSWKVVRVVAQTINEVID